MGCAWAARSWTRRTWQSRHGRFRRHGPTAELCRALAHPSSIVILDEPFSGLDAHTKARCIDLVNRELSGRTLIIASHDEDDAAALGCDIVRL